MGCGVVGAEVVTGVPGIKVGDSVVGGTVGALGANVGAAVVGAAVVGAGVGLAAQTSWQSSHEAVGRCIQS